MRAEEKRGIESRPLEGLRIAVTRPGPQAEDLAARLRDFGAEPLYAPTVRIEEPPDLDGLTRAVEQLAEYDWIVFTSANGVARFWQQLGASTGEQALPKGARVAAIGPATAAALERRGVEPELVPTEYVAEAVADALIDSESMAGRRVLLPHAAGARRVLPDRLRAAGAEVDEVVAYESVPDEEGIAALRAGIDRGEVDMITFAAASAVRHFAEVAGPDLGNAKVAVIGPITAEAARTVGVRVDVEAREYTVAGLLEAISDYVTHLDTG